MEYNSKTIEFAKKLISFNTTNPPGNQTHCPEWIENLLKEHQIDTRIIEHDGTRNIIAELDFGPGKTLCICGHWDVTHANEPEWESDPFKAIEKDGNIYGRGIADMKGSLAATLSCVLNIKKHNPNITGKILFIAFGDEETGSERGAKRIIDDIADELDYIIIGEPTNMNPKIARRGTILLNLKVFNSEIDASDALHKIINSLSEVNKVNMHYEEPEEFCSIKSKIINSEEIPRDTTPDQVELSIDVRHMKLNTLDDILNKISTSLDRLGAIYKIQATLVTQPYNTKEGKLLETAINSIIQTTGRMPTVETNDASSDARFFAKKGLEIIELGVNDSTIHMPNENCSIKELENIEKIYYKLITSLLGN
ncbi:MAG: succinyl-diaminopimelate desuccinylase [Candidatus Aenigmarchaeota archaeon]|nr:succinyl-diaminopimelate desuccinylase [Candidatus Aenigmarchaeota archaeon]